MNNKHNVSIIDLRSKRKKRLTKTSVNYEENSITNRWGIELN